MPLSELTREQTMSNAAIEVAGWQIQQRQALMTRRYEFGSYDDTRSFLDRLADLSKQQDYYPDLNFGKNHVNVSIASETKELGEESFAFAQAVNDLIAANNN